MCCICLLQLQDVGSPSCCTILHVLLACQALQQQCLRGYLCCKLIQLSFLCADNNSAAPPIIPLLWKGACNICPSS